MLTLEKRKVKTAKGETFVYYIRGRCPYTKQDIRKSTKTSSREQASDLLTIFLQKQRERALHGDHRVATFAEAAVVYLQGGGDGRFLDPLLDRFGTQAMADITDRHIADFASDHYAGRSAATIVRQVYVPLQAVWNAAARSEPPLALPRLFRKPKIEKKAVAYAKTDDHLIALIKAMPELGHKAATLFASFSGARASEVVAALVEDYDPDHGTILLTKTKNSDARLVHLPEFVNEACKLLPRDNPKAPLFGMKSRFNFYDAVKRASRAAGIPFLSPHRIGRHTFAARFLRDGNSLVALKQAGGWRSVGAVMQYAHLERSSVDAAVRNVSTPLARKLLKDD